MLKQSYFNFDKDKDARVCIYTHNWGPQPQWLQIRPCRANKQVHKQTGLVPYQQYKDNINPHEKRCDKIHEGSHRIEDQKVFFAENRMIM